MATTNEVIVALSETLQMRDDCPSCGGGGWNWIDIDGEAERDPCSCVFIVEEVLRQYKKEIDEAINGYLEERGYDVEKLKEDIKTLVNELLSEDREIVVGGDDE